MAPKKIRQEVRIRAKNVPTGSRFKGYQDYAVQELEITPKDVIYRLEVWQTPDGNFVRATLPQEAQGSLLVINYAGYYIICMLSDVVLRIF